MVGEVVDFPDPQAAKHAAHTSEAMSKIATRRPRAGRAGRAVFTNIHAV